MIGKLLCRLVGHGQMVRWRTRPGSLKSPFSYGLHSTLSAQCLRCGKTTTEHRWGFTRDCGSLTHIAGGEVDAD